MAVNSSGVGEDAPSSWSYGYFSGKRYHTEEAICPVLHIDLSSKTWKKVVEKNEMTEPTIKPSIGHDYGISNPRISSDNIVTWDKIVFGNYVQKVEYDKQPIKWRILSVNEDGSNAFVMADKALDCKPYNEVINSSFTSGNNTDFSCDWEKSTLRNWLNTEFYNEAFNAGEKEIIIDTKVENVESENGNDTVDKVYILSMSEACNEKYGFYNELNSSVTNSTASRTRLIKATDYIGGGSQGYYDRKSYYYKGNCNCWLRSLVYNSALNKNLNYIINTEGAIGPQLNNSSMVCPVMHINLNSDLIKDAGEVDSDGDISSSFDKQYNNPQIENGVTTWDCIYFGHYKQDNNNLIFSM